MQVYVMIKIYSLRSAKATYCEQLSAQWEVTIITLSSSVVESKANTPCLRFHKDIYKKESLIMSRVLVTGASGFLASHVVRQLLEAGEYRVRGTVRSLANETKVVPLRRLCPENAQYELELVEADLMNKASWQEYVS